MNSDLKEFELIWRHYCNLLPVNEYEYNLYTKIIYKIRASNMLLTKLAAPLEFTSNEKTHFIDLLAAMSNTIYSYKKEGEEDKMDRDLDCCYRIKQYLLKEHAVPL
jgi:hypothetical protein